MFKLREDIVSSDSPQPSLKDWVRIQQTEQYDGPVHGSESDPTPSTTEVIFDLRGSPGPSDWHGFRDVSNSTEPTTTPKPIKANGEMNARGVLKTCSSRSPTLPCLRVTVLPLCRSDQEGIRIMPGTGETGSIVQLLERHQARREQGIPTVSLLVGPPALSSWEWQSWHHFTDRLTALTFHSTVDELVKAWVSNAVSPTTLHSLAVNWVSREVGITSAELGDLLSRKMGVDRVLFLEDLSGRLPDNDVAALAREIFRDFEALHSDRAPADQLSWFEPLFQSTIFSTTRLIGALVGFMSPTSIPSLCSVVPRAAVSQLEWFTAVARSVTHISANVPLLPLALCIDTNTYSNYLGNPGFPHTKAVLKEGEVPVPGLQLSDCHGLLDPAKETPSVSLEKTVSCLVRDGVSPGLLRGFSDLVSLVEGADFDEESSLCGKARSAAESFLFDRLESLEDTRGLFELNGNIGGDGGPYGRLEVDLLSRTKLVAVEIDGYYHFKNRDAYRRDRRKDVQLQRQGFLVLRFLAEDVVERLEEILDVIRTALISRSN